MLPSSGPPPLPRLRTDSPFAISRPASVLAEDSGLHTFVLGLILVAVAIPFKVIIEELFAQANEPEFPERLVRVCPNPNSRLCLLRPGEPASGCCGGWLWDETAAVRRLALAGTCSVFYAACVLLTPLHIRNAQVTWPLKYRLYFLSGMNWHFDVGKPNRLKINAARFPDDNTKIWFTMAEELYAAISEGVERLKQFIASRRRGAESPAEHQGGGDEEGSDDGAKKPQHEEASGEEGDDAGDEKEAYEEGKEAAKERVGKKYTSLILIYVSWGIMTWICFTCARLPSPAPPALNSITT